MAPARTPAVAGSAAHNATAANCWNTGTCPHSQQCFVHFKTASAGLAQCRDKCPPNWLCETRVPDASGAACGPAPLKPNLVPPTDEMRDMIATSPWAGAVSLCDRANPPPGPTFEITCYDGGQTGNRYVMVGNLLKRAACCSGVALLPPEFDHFPQSGASCVDFRGLRQLSAKRGSASPPPLPIAHATTRICASNVSSSSKRWWTTHAHETSTHCQASVEMNEIIRMFSTMYVGFGVPGKVFRDTVCEQPATPTLTMHLRSGEIFTNWKDGKHIITHGGFQHDPTSRGQPPLAFYQSAARHALTGNDRRDDTGESHLRIGVHGYAEARLATSPDRANPVAQAMLPRAPNSNTTVSATLGVPLSLASSESFQQDLAQLLCAQHLVLARSSLNIMLVDSPNVKDVYDFNPNVNGCGAPVPCQRPAVPTKPGGRYDAFHRAQISRQWCISASGGSNYSLLASWRNSKEQVDEMLKYANGQMGNPVLTGCS